MRKFQVGVRREPPQTIPSAVAQGGRGALCSVLPAASTPSPFSKQSRLAKPENCGPKADRHFAEIRVEKRPFHHRLATALPHAAPKADTAFADRGRPFPTSNST
jgi:hypothetical protein